MATEDDLRDAQKQYLVAEMALEKAKAWTPNMIDVAQLVIARINDKYAGTKPEVEESVELVFAVLTAVNKRLAVPGVWAVPTAAPAADGAIR